MKHLRTFDCSKCHIARSTQISRLAPCRLARPARDSEMHLAYRGNNFRCFPGPNQHISCQFWFLAMPVHLDHLSASKMIRHNILCHVFAVPDDGPALGGGRLTISCRKRVSPVREVFPGEVLSCIAPLYFYFWELSDLPIVRQLSPEKKENGETNPGGPGPPKSCTKRTP